GTHGIEIEWGLLRVLTSHPVIPSLGSQQSDAIRPWSIGINSRTAAVCSANPGRGVPSRASKATILGRVLFASASARPSRSKAMNPKPVLRSALAVHRGFTSTDADGVSGDLGFGPAGPPPAASS